MEKNKKQEELLAKKRIIIEGSNTSGEKLQKLQEMLFSNKNAPLLKKRSHSSDSSSSAESVSIRVSDSISDHSAPDMSSPRRNRIFRWPNANRQP